MTRIWCSFLLMLIFARLKADLTIICSAVPKSLEIQEFGGKIQSKSLEEIFSQSIEKKSGAFGMVVKLTQKIGSNFKKTAVKKINLTSKDPKYKPLSVDAVEREIEILKELSGSNHTPEFFGCYYDQQNEVVYIVMQAFEKNLEDQLFTMEIQYHKNKFRFVPVIKSLFKGLELLAEHGIIHNDIKPENLMTDDGMQVFIVDFGLAQRINRPKEIKNEQLQPNHLEFHKESKEMQVLSGAGTLGYVSPEKLKSKIQRPEVDIFAAIISLGKILSNDESKLFENKLKGLIAEKQIEITKDIFKSAIKKLCSHFGFLPPSTSGGKVPNGKETQETLKRLIEILNTMSGDENMILGYEDFYHHLWTVVKEVEKDPIFPIDFQLKDRKPIKEYKEVKEEETNEKGFIIRASKINTKDTPTSTSVRISHYREKSKPNLTKIAPNNLPKELADNLRYSSNLRRTITKTPGKISRANIKAFEKLDPEPSIKMPVSNFPPIKKLTANEIKKIQARSVIKNPLGQLVV